jgi:hypothetical protein
MIKMYHVTWVHRYTNDPAESSNYVRNHILKRRLRQLLVYVQIILGLAGRMQAAMLT